MGNGWSRRTCAGRPAREASTRASDSAQIEAFRFKPACGMEVGEARGMSGRTFTAELCASIPWSPARSGEGDGEHGSRKGADWGVVPALSMAAKALCEMSRWGKDARQRGTPSESLIMSAQ